MKVILPKLSERVALVVKEYQKYLRLTRELDLVTKQLAGPMVDILTMQHAQLLVKLVQLQEPDLASEET